MTWAGNFYRSAVGKKAVMAVTGVILFGWIFLHMAGNMKLYFGPEHFNDYAKWIRTIGTPLVPEKGALWISRLILLVAVAFHIHAATALTLMSRKARPIGYRERDYVAPTHAARTMRWGGVIILLFVIYHILHLTTGSVHQSFIETDPYHNLVAGFQVWWVAALYIIANVALGLHLHQGLWSMFYSVGLIHPTVNRWRRHFATSFALVIILGNISFPISVLLGWVR